MIALLKKKSFGIFQIFLGIFSFYIFIDYYWFKIYLDLMSSLSSIENTIQYFLIFLVLKGFNYIFKSLHTEKIYKSFLIKISAKNWFALSIAQGLVSNFMPLNIGSVLKMVYLKIRFKLKFINFGKIEILSFIIFYYIYFCFLVAGIIGKVSLNNHYATLLILILTISLFPVIQNLTIYILRLKNYPTFNFQSYGYGILNNMFYFLIIYFISIVIFNHEASPQSILIYTSAIQLTMIINLTPANIGLREWFMALVAPLVGLSQNEGALISIIDRTFSILFLLVFYPYSFKTLFSDKNIRISTVLKRYKLDKESRSKK